MLIPKILTRKGIGYYPSRLAVYTLIRSHHFFADKDTNNFNTPSQNLCH